jgi:hypothetical protein
MAKVPSRDVLDTAIAWLRENTGPEGERDKCRVVANFLEALEYEDMLRREARSASVPVRRLRAKLAQMRRSQA